MRHARNADLDRIEPLLERLRALPGLVERKRGTFYLRSKAFLHFHDDPAGLFADIRAADGKDFDRLKVDTLKEQDALIVHAMAILDIR
jgi:hypothetical protein